MFGGLLYWDDLVETWIKFKQRGWPFILSKLQWNNSLRTLSSFQNEFIHANWWIIPAIQMRMNEKITGTKSTTYEEYITKKYLTDSQGKQMISIGCGTGSHEIRVALLNPLLHVTGYDLSGPLLQEAREKALAAGVKNISFIKADAYQLSLTGNTIDYFLFNASMHHFHQIEDFVRERVKPSLKKNGLVFINEYVGPNKMNFSTSQMKASSALLNHIPEQKRKIAFTSILKSRSYRLGKWRMILSDPSECIESEKILPVLHTYFTMVEEKPLGGNLLMPALKHIAHHFVNDDRELARLFDLEDEYLIHNNSNYLFGVYRS